MGEAQDAETEALQLGVAGAVALEGRAVAVVAKTVGLDDQGPIAPEEIDFVLVDAGVHLWLGKAVAAAEREE
jgi:hypothetical protein